MKQPLSTLVYSDCCRQASQLFCPVLLEGQSLHISKVKPELINKVQLPSGENEHRRDFIVSCEVHTSMKAVYEYLVAHPYYIPFVILNLYAIYWVIRKVMNDEFGDDRDDDEDDDEDPYLPDGPELDLPPGVSLPIEPELVED